MAKAGAKPVVLGFLTVRGTPARGVRGGYLITTDYSRPIEFHYTTELRISDQQRLLYGASFETAIYADLLAKSLTDRQKTAPHLVVVDHPALLDLRRQVPAPVIFLQPVEPRQLTDLPFEGHAHPEFKQDLAAFEKVRTLTPTGLDWLEPFDRLDQALSEIRDPEPALAG